MDLGLLVPACWPQTYLLLLYGHQAFPMLPHPAAPLLSWMLHVFNFPLVDKLWLTILRIFSLVSFSWFLLNFSFVSSCWATTKYLKRLWEIKLVPWYSGDRTKTKRLIFTYREVWSLLCFSCPSTLKKGHWVTKRQNSILAAVFSMEGPMPWMVFLLQPYGHLQA